MRKLNQIEKENDIFKTLKLIRIFMRPTIKSGTEIYVI